MNQVQAIVRCLDGSFYYSMVFGCICTKKHQLANDVWYDYAYLILDKTKTKLILQHEFLPNNKFYEPMLLFLDADQSDWQVNEIGEGGIHPLISPEILENLRDNRVPHSLVLKCVDLDSKLKQTNYRHISNEQECKNFLTISRHLHDAYIEKIVLRENKLLVTFDGVWGCKIILSFADNPSFHYTQNIDYDFYWKDCSLLIRDNRYYLVDEDLADGSQITEYHQWFTADQISYWVLPKCDPLLPSNKVVPFQQSGKLRLAEVAFDEYGKLYTYACPDRSMTEDDWVVVPVGKENVLKEAQIINIYESYPETLHLNFPLTKLKTVAKLYSTFNEERAIERVLTLMDKKVLDFSTVDPNFKEGIYHMLETPMGYFWIELNQQPIPMKIIQYSFVDDEYSVDCVLKMQPIGVTPDKIKTLKLLSNIDLTTWNEVNVVSDEFGEGWQWEKGGLTFGASGIITNFDGCEVSSSERWLPFYDYWRTEMYNRNPDYYGFMIAWKKFVSIEDLSIDFALT